MKNTYTKHKMTIIIIVITSLSFLATYFFVEKEDYQTFLFPVLGTATAFYYLFGKKSIFPVLLTSGLIQLISRITLFSDSFFIALYRTLIVSVFIFSVMSIFNYTFKKFKILKNYQTDGLAFKQILPYAFIIILNSIIASFIYVLGSYLLLGKTDIMSNYFEIFIAIFYGLVLFNLPILINYYYRLKTHQYNKKFISNLLYMLVFIGFSYLIFSNIVPFINFYRFSFIFFLLYIISALFFDSQILFLNNIVYILMYSIFYNQPTTDSSIISSIVNVNVFLSVMCLTSLILIILHKEFYIKEIKMKKANQTTVNLVNTTNKYFSSTDYFESDPYQFFINFIKDIFQIGCNIMPKFNRASCYIQDGSFVKFISCKGYDLNVLNSLKFKKEKFSWGFEKPIIIKGFNNEGDKFGHDDGYQIYEAAYGKIKESICFAFEFNEEIVCSMSFDIIASNSSIYNSEDFEAYVTFQKLINSYKSFGQLYSSALTIRDDLILSFIRTLGVYDDYTEKHSEEVANMAVEVCSIMNLEKSIIEKAYLASCVHDIGKVGIDNRILNKPSKLTDEEYAIIKEHTVNGYEILNNIDSLKDIAKIIRHHHERWDGLGYPDSLKEDEIPFISQIISVCDSVSAMLSDRPYKKSKSIAETIEELKANKGKQFSPKPCEAMIGYLTKKITCRLAE